MGIGNLLAQTPTPTPTCGCALLQPTYASGTPGPGSGELSGNSYLAVGTLNSTEYIYIADINNNRIDQFNASTGTFTASFTGVGPNNTCFGGGIASPYGVALSADGRYLFASGTNNGSGCVAKMDLMAGGNPVTAFSATHPIGLAVDASGNVYVGTDSTVTKYKEQTPNHYVQVAVLGTPGVTGPGTSQFNQAYEVLPQGNNLLITDSSNNRIVLWTSPDGVNYTYNQTVFYSASGIAPTQMTAEPGTSRVYVGTSNDGFLVLDSATTPWSFLYQCSPAGQAYVPGIGVDSANVFFSLVLLAKGGACPKPDSSCFAPLTLPTNTPTPGPTPAYAGANPPASGGCFIYPSPARGSTATVCYDMAQAGQVDLKVWNESGEWAAEIKDRKGAAGAQVTSFDISHFARGVYYYALTLTYDSGASEKPKAGKFAVIH